MKGKTNKSKFSGFPLLGRTDGGLSPLVFVYPPAMPPCVCLPTRHGGPHGQTESGGRILAVNAGAESGGRILAVNAGARAPRGRVTRKGVVLADLQSLLDCQ